MLKNKFIIQTPLFHKCHLDCGFCMERIGLTRSNTIDEDYIKSLPDRSVNLYRDWILEDRPKDIYLEICGGEIFMVGLPESIYSLMEYYIEETIRLIKEEFDFVDNVHVELDTSLIYINTNKLNYFLDKYGGSINTSYDSYGRFTSMAMKNLWYSMITKYRDHIGNIEFVFYKDGIETMMKDSFIDKLRDYELNASWYLPVNSDYRDKMPNDDLLYRFLNWGVTNSYFNMVQIRDCIKTIIAPNEVVKYCDCFESNSYASDPTIELNCFDSIKDDDFYRDKSMINESFTTKQMTIDMMRGCFVCEYNGRCQKMCAAMVNSKYYKLDDECPFKRIYKYIEANKSIIENYERMCDNGKVYTSI